MFLADVVTAVCVVAGIVIALYELKQQRKLTAKSLKHQHKLAARRATLDFISKFEVHNRQWIELREKFALLRGQNQLAEIANPRDEDRGETIRIATFLNHFELVAVAIKHGILDEEIYKDWFRSAYIRAWEDAHSFVIELRRTKDEDKLFAEFEKLAIEWKTNPSNAKPNA